MSEELSEHHFRGSLATDSGMWSIYDPAYFAAVHDYDTWEAELLEDNDVMRHIELGHIVPINIGSDGIYEFEVRVGTASKPQSLSQREQKYLAVSSKPYSLLSQGTLAISGIEYVEARPSGNIGLLAIPEGNHSVTIHLIDWQSEPGSATPDGQATPQALPDFVVLVNPTAETAGLRTELETFER